MSPSRNHDQVERAVAIHIAGEQCQPSRRRCHADGLKASRTELKGKPVARMERTDPNNFNGREIGMAVAIEVTERKLRVRIPAGSIFRVRFARAFRTFEAEGTQQVLSQ
jgi:hypothetical protein